MKPFMSINGINQTTQNELVKIGQALNCKDTVTILNFVEESKETTVSNIYRTMNMEQSVTSQHLKKLRNLGWVTTNRKGKCIYYSISSKFKMFKNIVSNL